MRKTMLGSHSHLGMTTTIAEHKKGQGRSHLPDGDGTGGDPTAIWDDNGGGGDPAEPSYVLSLVTKWIAAQAVTPIRYLMSSKLDAAQVEPPRACPD
jgi:hypothetical protein